MDLTLALRGGMPKKEKKGKKGGKGSKKEKEPAEDDGLEGVSVNTVEAPCPRLI